MPATVAFVRRGRGAPAPLEVRNTCDKNHDAADDAEPRRRPGIGAEKRRGNDVLNLRRAGQRIHRERERPKRDRTGYQTLRNIAATENLRRKRIDREYDHEQRNTAVR